MHVYTASPSPCDQSVAYHLVVIRPHSSQYYYKINEDDYVDQLHSSQYWFTSFVMQLAIQCTILE